MPRERHAGRILLCIACTFMAQAIAAQITDIAITLSIGPVIVNGGDVHVALFNNAESYAKRKPEKSAILAPSSDRLELSISVPSGDWLASAYQDRNDNKALDKNFFGIPVEPIGLSNYEGKGIPGDFNALKTRVNRDGQTLRLRMVSL